MGQHEREVVRAILIGEELFSKDPGTKNFYSYSSLEFRNELELWLLLSASVAPPSHSSLLPAQCCAPVKIAD